MLHITTTDNNCAKNVSFSEPISPSHYAELSQIANIPLSELCEKNKNLLVFPDNATKTYGSIGDEKIFEMSGSIDCRVKPCDVSERNSVNNDINRKSENDSHSEQNVRHSKRSEESVKNDKQTLKRVQGDTNIKIKTGNLMGFIGSGSTQIQITSRFTPAVVESVETTTNDFFLHYMLAKVFCPNLLNLKFDAFSNIKNQFDYLCFLFPLYLKNAMKQGIFKTYQKFERNDANVRGAINVPRHIAKNIPFAGKVAYTERTRTYDNPLTELVRHTIELIKTKPFGKAIFSEKNTKQFVSQIVEVTPIYNFFEREKIIFKNAKPLSHPFFTEWKPLQKLCLAILQNRKINFHADSNEVYGILFDGAWLWEEYLATILKPLGFLHPENKESRGGLHFFDNEVDKETFDKNYRKIYPDFYRKIDCRVVSTGSTNADNENRISILDAKYKHLENGVGREDLYQVVSYIHTMSKPGENVLNGGFVFPTKDSRVKPENDKYDGFDVADTEFTEVQPPRKPYKLAGLGGKISVIGFEIPQNAAKFFDFCKEIEKSENDFASLLA